MNMNALLTRPAAASDPVMVSPYDAADFKREGLRPYNLYRETPLARMTGGRFGARVQRSLQAVPGPQGLHVHSAEFQLIYVLKGGVSFWYEGLGDVALGEGAIVYQPKGVRHQMTDLSEGCEILEVTIPAEFETREVD